jgi:hypothetical protein
LWIADLSDQVSVFRFQPLFVFVFPDPPAAENPKPATLGLVQ